MRPMPREPPVTRARAAGEGEEVVHGCSGWRTRAVAATGPAPAYTARSGSSWARPLLQSGMRDTPDLRHDLTRREEHALEQKWPQTLWIVRHGQSAGNVARDAAELGGLRDDRHRRSRRRRAALAARRAAGRRARRLVRRRCRAEQRPEVVLSSPYVRARQTADRVLAALQPRRRRRATTRRSPASATSGCARRSSASSTG